MTTEHDVSQDERRRPLRKPLKRETLADSAYEQIRRAILQGELEDGAVLKQVELARELEVSTVPVREALRRLQAEQLLVASPYQRYVVRALSPSQVEEYLAIRSSLEELSLLRLWQQPDDVVEARATAASVVAAQLGVDLSDDQWFETDLAFHRSLAGPDSLAGLMVEDIQHKLRRYTHEHGDATRKQALREHGDLLRATRSRDAARARAILQAHVRAGSGQELDGAIATHR